MGYLNTHPISTQHIDNDDNITRSHHKNDPDSRLNCKCLKADITNGQIHFETPLILNYYFYDETISSLYYPVSWTLDSSLPINLTINVKDNMIKVMKSQHIELIFESFFSKKVWINIKNKNFNFSFGKCNYLMPFKTKNELST